MGEKLEEYLDNAGNTVRDDDTVVYDGREYRVAYISHLYVNLDGGRHNWLHLPFHVGVPERKVANAPKTAQPSPVREVTTVRKEIVPGVYGRVEVWEDCSEGGLAVDVKPIRIDRAGMAELTNAIDTLTAIRDAMAYSSVDVSTAQAR